MPAEKMKTSRRKQTDLTAEHRALVNEYFSTIAQLNMARSNFQYITDPELISASVYEINALQEKYTFLLGRIKDENITYLQVLR